jgi:hypothetical protein
MTTITERIQDMDYMRGFGAYDMQQRIVAALDAACKAGTCYCDAIKLIEQIPLVSASK